MRPLLLTSRHHRHNLITPPFSTTNCIGRDLSTFRQRLLLTDRNRNSYINALKCARDERFFFALELQQRYS